MRKLLRIVALISGMISILSIVILAFIYFEDLARYLKKIRNNMRSN